MRLAIFLLVTVLPYLVPVVLTACDQKDNQDQADCSSTLDTMTTKSEIDTYQHIIVSGLPFTRGQSHGTQAKEKIITALNFYKTSSSLPPWEDCVKFVRDNYISAIEKYFPSGLEEMKGIADGANVSLEDILILNSRYDLSRAKRAAEIKLKSQAKHNKTVNLSSFKSKRSLDGASDKRLEDQDAGECTGAVVLKSATQNGNVLIGQNWDINEFILKNDTAILLEVHPHSSENKKSFIMLGEAGQLGRSGMNAGGLGITAMGLWSSNDIFERDLDKQPNGWVPATLLRRMFLESPSFPDGLRTIIRTPRHVSNNILIATAEDEALNIELTPNNQFITQVLIDKELFVHSNHFKSSSFLSRNDIREGSRGGSSLFRDRRVEKSLTSHWPNITESSFQEAFKDHVGYPDSVCAHTPIQTTVASVIYNLSKRTLQLCKGPPCHGVFKDYRITL